MRNSFEQDTRLPARRPDLFKVRTFRDGVWVERDLTVREAEALDLTETIESLRRWASRHTGTRSRFHAA